MTDDVDYLSIEDLLAIVERLVGPGAVRDAGLLDSACARPQSTVFGQLAYPTLDLQAGALLHSLARNHPLVDGNKRLAWVATRAFLALNGVEIAYSVDEAEAFVLAVARGELDVPDIAAWLSQHRR